MRGGPPDRPGGDLEGPLGPGQRPLGADDALGDGRLGGEEGAGDLLRRQATHEPQSERDPGLRRQHGMAGGEDQAQQVVVEIVGVRGLGRRQVVQRPADLGQLACIRVLTAYEVDGAVLGGGHEPGARIARDTGGRPRGQRGDERVLCELFGDAFVPHDAGHTGDDPA